MDLLDLYHAHEYGTNDEGIIEENREEYTQGDNLHGKKQKKPKYVPWEPYKAATGAIGQERCDHGNNMPEQLPQLIAYSIEKTIKKSKNKRSEQNNNCMETDNRMMGNGKTTIQNNDEDKMEHKNLELESKIEELSNELKIEQKVNSELKRLMIATLNEELQVQVEALTEDKVRLAHRVDEYMGKLVVEDEELDQIRIDRDVWKCKFLAQSIRCNELIAKNEYLLKVLDNAQRVLKERNLNTDDIEEFINIDFQPLYHRSPCDEKLVPKQPKFTNLTIGCCKNCSGKDIQLL